MKNEAIHILKTRIIEDSIKNIDSSRAMKFCNSINSDGSWNDIDYTSQAWANWPLRIHFIRIKEMACAYADKGNEYYQSETLKKAVCMGTDFWRSREWLNPNWWNMEMLPQQEMRYVALLMGETLGETRTEFIAGILQDEVEEKWTGANCVWFAENVMFKGILTENEKLISHASKAIMSTAKCDWDELFASEDGIQPDGSFTQHGRLLYNNGYGAAWLDSISFWVYQLRGLPIGAEQKDYEKIVSALLDGTMWMQHRGVIDPGTCGREISRKRLGIDARICKAAHRLLETARTEGYPRESELYALEQYLNGNEAALPDGNKMFWRVDYMSHRKHGFTASVKMLSRGVKGSESILNENKLGGFLSYGMTTFMQHGREYFGSGRDDGIFSVMDWTHMPGVTAPAVEVSAADTNAIETTFAGGVSDGYNGAAAMEYEKILDSEGGEIPFGGKKAYFFFDGGAVILGADLHCDTDVDFDTTVNQCRFAGMSYLDGQKAEDIKTHKTGAWVNHDSIGYVFFEPTEYNIEQGLCEGSWERITDSYPSDRDTITRQNVFKLYIRHGTNAENKTCAYMVLPGQSEDETAVTAINPPAEIISNNGSLQAVYFEMQKTAYLIFYEAGTCSISKKLAVSVSDRCMLIIKETEDSIKMYASNPETPALKLNVTLRYNETKIAKTVVFPKGETFLGKTVEII